MENKNLITEAIDIAGLLPLAKACGLTYQSVRKWEKAGRLPRTEWTGETNYSQVFEDITKGEITREQMLQQPSGNTA